MNKNTKVTSSNKYDTNRIKHIHTQIENIKDTEALQQIFTILATDKNFEYINNPDGVFINLSALSVNTLKKVEKIINSPKVLNKDEEILPTSINKVSSSKVKLNNHEKNLLKQREIKKRLDGTKSYEIYKFSD